MKDLFIYTLYRIYTSQTLRATYTNRLLYAAVPSAMYAKNDKTFDGLFDALVQDFNRLYEGGFEVPQPVICFLTVVCGVRGS